MIKNYTHTFKYLLLGILLCVAMNAVLMNTVNPYTYTILIYIGINIVMASSLNLIIGIAGQFSMGHAGFMAIGAYASSFLSLKYSYLVSASALPIFLAQGLFFFAVLLFGGLAAAVLGYLVGLPSLRLKGDYLAIVTLGFGEIIRVLILNIETIGGARGLPGIPAYTNVSWVYGLSLVFLFFMRRLMHSHHGRALLSIREDEIAAEAMGVPTTRYKVIAFVLSAFMAGVGGGLFAHFLTYINPSTFDFNKSFEFIIMVVLGGIGSMSGAVLAAAFLTAIKELLRPLQEITMIDLRMVIFSITLIGLMLIRPNGFLGTKELTDLKIFKRFKLKRGASSP